MTFRRFLLALIFLAVAITAYMYSVAVRDPVIRTATIALPDWPVDAPPLRVMLISDVHIAGPDMPPERLQQIVDQVIAVAPDLVLFAGDFISEKRTASRYFDAAELTKPLSALRAPLGVVAVMGNHDHWHGLQKVRDALAGANVEILDNEAIRRGPLIIGGVDDDFTDHADTDLTIAAIEKLEQAAGGIAGARIMLSHSPDIMPEIPSAGDDGHIALLLAGHTHCGQISIPFIGPLTSVSRYGYRYNCGIVREDGKTLVVGAGLGTSILPLRLGAVPDMWLLTLGPKARP